MSRPTVAKTSLPTSNPTVFRFNRFFLCISISPILLLIQKTDVKETFVSGAILIMENVVWYRMESGRFQIIAFLCFFFACFNLFPFPSCRRSSASLSTPSDLLQFMLSMSASPTSQSKSSCVCICICMAARKLAN